MMYLLVFFFILVVILNPLVVFDILNLLEVEDRCSDLDPRRSEHVIELFAVVARKIPVLDNSSKLIL